MTDLQQTGLSLSQQTADLTFCGNIASVDVILLNGTEDTLVPVISVCKLRKEVTAISRKLPLPALSPPSRENTSSGCSQGRGNVPRPLLMLAVSSLPKLCSPQPATSHTREGSAGLHQQNHSVTHTAKGRAVTLCALDVLHWQ